MGEGEVPHLFNAMGSIRRTLAASLRYGHLPTPEEIDAIMQVNIGIVFAHLSG